MKKLISLILVVLAFLLVPISIVSADAKYGVGPYGRCSYGNCEITITTSGAINVDVTPTNNPKCTITADDITVSTHNSAGFTLTANTNTTHSNLVDGSKTIAGSGGTPSSPQALSNSWGFRVDNLASMGAGPTSAVVNAAPGTLDFAGFPIWGDPGVELQKTSVYAEDPVLTKVWIGVCVDASTQSGNYTTGVTYTAVAN